MNKYTRLFALLLCIPLLLSLFPVMGVSAAEISAGEKATYVLTYDSDSDEYAGPELQYFTPYRVRYRMNNSSLKTMKTCIFSLYNTVDDTVIPVYCSDIDTMANSNYTYRRINLEDSTYAASAAGLIRAIVNHGFYILPVGGETDAEHAARVAVELEALGTAVGVTDLTIGEAIAGTQAAIWQATHGASLVYNDLMYSAYKTDISDTVRYYDICDEERWNGHLEYDGFNGELFNLTTANDKELGQRIEAVYDYLMALTPMAPQDTIVSTASFRGVQGPYFYDNGDGTFDLEVIVTTDVRMEAGDTLTLTASVGDGAYSASAPLTGGTETVTLTIKNVPSKMKSEKILLEIAGLQSGSDVYLFDAEGDRGTSQSMVGMADSRLPVYASITTERPTQGTNRPTGGEEIMGEPERILNFYKTTLIPNEKGGYDRIPLEGITFDLYFVAEFSDYTTGKVVLPEAEDYEYPTYADFTLVTDAEGLASINLSERGMPDGVYLVVERDHPAINAPIDPFYVIVPGTTPDGLDYVYEITIQPKNELKGNIKIEKDVITLGNDSATVDAYTDHTWIISTNIPDDIGIGKSYVITDTLDPRLDYTGNLKVQVETADGETVVTELEEGEDYLLVVTDVDSLSAGTPSDSFSIALTPAGMKKVSGSVGTGYFVDYMIRVYFDARINANATMATEIPNQASLYYTNSVNFDYSAQSDKPVVYTGGASILKIDGVNPDTVLPGAVFEVYRRATADEVTAGENLATVPGFPYAMVKVEFFDNEALTGAKVAEATSGADGKIYLYGLAYGTYYIMETKAPAGYNLPGEGVEITIDDTSHTEDRTIVVQNLRGSMLPSTGGPGTEGFMLWGAVLMVGAVVLLLILKRKDSKSQEA